MLSAATVTQHLAAQLVFFLAAGGALGYMKGSRISLVASGICAALETFLALWARRDARGVPYLAFFNLFLATGFGRKLFSSEPKQAAGSSTREPRDRQGAAGSVKRCPMTGKVGLCPGGGAARAAPTKARQPEEDPELIDLAEKAAPRFNTRRLTSLVLVVWSLSTAVVAFTTWHSRAKVPLISATLAMTALSLMRE